MSTLARTLALGDPHEGGIEDVEALVRKVADDRLRSWGARLNASDHEDLVVYLIGTCWELSKRYDAAKDKKPNFAAYASKILTLRCADWFRGRFGDTRHGLRPIVLSLDAPLGADGEGPDAGERRLVDSLTSSEGDPAADRAPDLVGILERRSGGEAGALEALGEPPARRAPARARKVKGKSRVPPMHRSRPKLPLPTCETCLNVFTAAYARVNSLRAAEKRLSSDEVLALAEGR